MTKMRALSSLKEFSQVPVETLRTLAEYSRFSSIEAGEYITLEGDSEKLSGFIVISGCISILKNSVSGKELIVELLQAGDVFGLLLTLAAERLPFQLTARSIKKSTILWVPIRNLNQLLESNPNLIREFATHLLVCLQSSYEISRGLAHDRVEVRIAAMLVALALKFGNGSSTRKHPLIRFTRKQIADLTGTSAETAIRITRSMQRDGLIDISRPGIIVIRDITALRALAES
jgi:CRP/FNR family transcriptional regulator